MTREEAINELQEHADAAWGGLSNAFNKAIQALRDQPRWIPVEEERPKQFQPVLVCRVDRYGVRSVDTGYYLYGTRWKISSYTTCGVTHWMPMPQPPAAEGGLRGG
jgi:hypothetical protein